MIPNEGDVLLAYMAWRQRKTKEAIGRQKTLLKRGTFITFITLEYGYEASQMRPTEVSHSNGPFVFQVGHLILTNSFSKEVINPADISTPKIWDQSDNWFKSYGQKVNFWLTES